MAVEPDIDLFPLRRPKSLADLPVEIFQHIAVQTAIPDQPGPPKNLTSLLLTSKQFHSRLAFDANPTFYAEIFDGQFDTAALRRRFHSTRLTAQCRAAELKRRWICLKRIKHFARGRQAVWGYPGFPGIYAEKDKLQDAWLAFLMLTENDGQNMQQLSWANIVEWTRSFVQFDVHAVSVNSQRSGQLPVVSELRALGLWLYWMTTKFDDVVNEPVAVLSKVNRMLRPFTFASWAYPSFFAPWQLSHVPPPNSYVPPTEPTPTPTTSTSTSTSPSTQPSGSSSTPTRPAPPPSRNPRRPPQPTPFPPQTPTNFLPPTIVLPSYLGHPLPLTPPLINHSAALLFFSRMQRFRLGEDSARAEDQEILRQFREERGSQASFTPRWAKTRFVWGEGSAVWDEDVRRLGEVCRTLKTRAMWKPVAGNGMMMPVGVAAVDEKKMGGPSAGPGAANETSPRRMAMNAARPQAAAAASFAAPLPVEDDVKGMKRYRYVPGTFAGEWEGRFVIYGLDAHQNVAQGVPGLQALESTVLTQDPQAWRIREYHHPSILTGTHRAQYEDKFCNKSSSSSSSASRTCAPPSHLRPPIRPAGQPLSAFIPRGLSVTKLRNGGLEAFDQGGGDAVFYAEVGQREALDANDGEDEVVGKGKEAGGVWDDVEPKEDDLNGRDDVEIIIEGESVRPVFAMDGRQGMMEPGSRVIGTIRRWDGLVTLLATPRSGPPRQGEEGNSGGQPRTQWLYRGYVTANGNWVGRWRDTWNDVGVEGYEGVFIMTRRAGGEEERKEEGVAQEA